jgi:transcriptional regulator with XRE-family HTH domain
MVALSTRKIQSSERLAPVVEFGTWLRSSREEANRAAADVAYRLGVTVSNIYQWELGYFLPSLKESQAKKYARLLGVPVAELRERLKQARSQVKQLKQEATVSSL